MCTVYKDKQPTKIFVFIYYCLFLISISLGLSYMADLGIILAAGHVQPFECCINRDFTKALALEYVFIFVERTKTPLRSLYYCLKDLRNMKTS